MRVVLDPNVIVSALLSTGTTAAVLDAWLDRQAYDPVVCPTLLAELEEVLSRPKFASLGRDVTTLVSGLRTEGVLTDDPEVQPGVTAPIAIRASHRARFFGRAAGVAVRVRQAANPCRT